MLKLAVRLMACACWAVLQAGAVTNDHAEILVTAEREPRPAHQSPAVAHRVDAATACAEAGARTLPDLLEGLPSVLGQKTAYGQGSPFLRGFTGFRTLALVDGIRLNNSVFRDGPNQYWSTIDPYSLDRIEAVMGPGSVLYGSDAIGGTVNAIGARPPEYRDGPTWSGRLDLRGALAEESVVGRLGLGLRPVEALGLSGGLTWKGFGDLRGGRDVGMQPKTGYDEWAYDLLGDWHVAPGHTLTLAHQTVEQDDVWRTHRTVYGLDWHGLARGDDWVHTYDQHRDLTYLRGRHEDLSGPVDTVTWTLSQQRQTEDLLRVRKDWRRDEQGFDVTTWGALLQAGGALPRGRWTAGVDAYRDDVDSYARKYKADGALDKIEIQGPVADDATYDTLGVYAQATLPFAGGRGELLPGVRYNHARADADAVKDPLTGARVGLTEDWDATVGSLRATWGLTADRRHLCFAGVAQGFRAPNLSDLTRFDIARSNEIETPAPDLDPERYVTAEVGFKSRLERFTFQAAAYRTWIRDLIVRAPTGRLIDESVEVTKRNAGEGFVHGIEILGRYRLGAGWSVWGAGTLMDGRADGYPTSDPEPQEGYVSRLMPPTGEAGARWEGAGGRLWGEAVAQAAARADHLAADDRRDTQRIPPGGTPGYAVAHLRGGVRVNRNLALGVAVENLFDKDYRIHGSGVNEPGRNLILTASCAF